MCCIICLPMMSHGHCPSPFKYWELPPCSQTPICQDICQIHAPSSFCLLISTFSSLIDDFRFGPYFLISSQLISSREIWFSSCQESSQGSISSLILSNKSLLSPKASQNPYQCSIFPYYLLFLNFISLNLLYLFLVANLLSHTRNPYY